MGLPVTIRRAGLSDHDAVRACVDAAYAPYIERIGRRPASMDTDFTPLLNDGSVWVAEQDGDVVAAVVFTAAGGEAEIRSLAVLPAVQRRGIGRALVDYAEILARAAGHSTMRLYTNARIPELVTYYTRLGYVEVERRLDAGYDRVFLTKRLHA